MQFDGLLIETNANFRPAGTFPCPSGQLASGTKLFRIGNCLNGLDRKGGKSKPHRRRSGSVVFETSTLVDGHCFSSYQFPPFALPAVHRAQCVWRQPNSRRTEIGLHGRTTGTYTTINWIQYILDRRLYVDLMKQKLAG